MATAFDTFDQYAFGQYDGQVADRSMADIISLVATGGAIGYGLAVRQTGQDTAALPTGSQTSHGITVRESVRGTNQSADNPTPEYEQDETMSVLRVGRIWVTTGDGASVGEPVYVEPTSGRLTNDPNGSANAMADSNNTGDGTIGSLGVVSGAIPGDYVAVCTATATDGGTFTVFNPDGQVIGEAEVGSAFDNGVQFTISDGAADFAEGDRFTINVTTTNVQFENAAWKSSATSGERALVQLNGAE